MEKYNVSHKARKRLRVRRSWGVGEEKPEKIKNVEPKLVLAENDVENKGKREKN